MLRRSLLTSAIAASLLTTFSLPAFATQVYETDLVIIGGGLSGLAAAQSAVDQGAKPIVLEKEAALGGGGNFPEGSLGVGTRYQKEHNINTTVDQVLTAALQYHHYRADPHVLRVLIEESGKTIDWVMDKGAEMRGIRTMYPKEESLMTWHLFKGGAAGIIQRFAKEVRAKGGTILTETPAKKLIVENGKVVGGDKSLKRQTVYSQELIYIQDPDKMQQAGFYSSISLSCPNCGAPIKKLGTKFCEYCGSGVKEINIRSWSFNDIKELNTQTKKYY